MMKLHNTSARKPLKCAQPGSSGPGTGNAAPMRAERYSGYVSWVPGLDAALKHRFQAPRREENPPFLRAFYPPKRRENATPGDALRVAWYRDPSPHRQSSHTAPQLVSSAAATMAALIAASSSATALSSKASVARQPFAAAAARLPARPAAGAMQVQAMAKPTKAAEFR
jgi:hypothetical protein